MKRQRVTRRSPTGNRPPGLRNGNAVAGVGARNGERKEATSKLQDGRYHNLLTEQNFTVAQVVEGDRLFFARYPDRTHRVRTASPAEIQEFRATPLPAGLRWFAVVRQVAPGKARIRALFPCHQGANLDVGETRCAEIFAAVVPGAQS